MIWTAPWPSRVTRLPPSMTVASVVGRTSVDVTGMVTGDAPQSNVMTPPFLTAASSTLNEQLDALPVPTTDAGFETLAGVAPEGNALPHVVGMVTLPEPPAPFA